MNDLSYASGTGVSRRSVTSASGESERLFVRSEGQLAVFEESRKPTGHVLTAREAVDAYGPAMLEEAVEYGAAIDMYFDGISYKRVAENLSTTFGIPKPSKQTVYAWLSAFPRRAQQAINAGGRKPATGDEWVADEMQVDVGGKRMWLWNVIDSKTRFLLATRLAPHRPAREATIVMRKAREAAGYAHTIRTSITSSRATPS